MSDLQWRLEQQARRIAELEMQNLRLERYAARLVQERARGEAILTEALQTIEVLLKPQEAA